MTRCLGADGRRQRHQPRMLGRAVGASRQMGVEAQLRDRVQFTIDGGVHQGAGLGVVDVGHHRAFSRVKARCISWRARARRDITVPIGTPMTAAISL